LELDARAKSAHLLSLPIHRLRRLMNTFRDATGNFDRAPTGVQRVAVVWTGRHTCRLRS
jgi:hypothetical protein